MNDLRLNREGVSCDHLRLKGWREDKREFQGTLDRIEALS